MKISSKKIADDFNLHHRSVLRSIRRLQNIEALKGLFQETSFEHKGGTYPAYLVSEVGFAILMSRFKVDDFKKVNYYLQRYAEERIKDKEEQRKYKIKLLAEKDYLNREVSLLELVNAALIEEKLELQMELNRQKNRGFIKRLFKKELA